MPVYRCNKCGHISESPTAGTQVPCEKCQAQCSVFDTAFYIGKLIERYSAAVREIRALQADDKNEPQAASQQREEDGHAAANTLGENPLNTPAQHAPIETWLKTKGIVAEFDYNNVDTSGYFDEAAVQLGQNYGLFAELIQRVAYAYRRDHTGLNINLSEVAQKDGQAIQALCRQLYSHTLFARYRYQKQEKNLHLSLQSAPKVRQFFTGAWLEWFALMETISAAKGRGAKFACARGIKVVFPNEDTHELDVVLLSKDRPPICVECKTGEFRHDIKKYQMLRKKLGVDASRFIVCSTEITDEQADSLTAMYELKFVNHQSLAGHLASII